MQYTTEQLINITKAVCNIARNVGKFQLEQQNLLKSNDITEKTPNQLVSYVDKESERQITSELKKLIPEAGFVTEEKTITNAMREWCWIVDPLDGTTNYIHHLPIFSISIGLLHNNEVVSGVIFDPSQNECFYASKGNGSYLNDKKIQVSDTTLLKNTLIATGFPYYDFSKTENYLEVFRQLMCSTRGIRRLGSAAIDLAYIACGRFDAFWEYGLQAWDVAASTCIIREAGGKVCDFKGGEDFIFGKTIVASNNAFFETFMSMIKQHFTK